MGPDQVPANRPMRRYIVVRRNRPEPPFAARACCSLLAGLIGFRRSCAPAAAEMPEGANDRPARSRPRSRPVAVARVQRTEAVAATPEPAWHDRDLCLQVWPRARG